LCWWAAVPWETPDAGVIADLLFTMDDVVCFETTTHGTYDLPGLGMTIARYNAGASGPGMKTEQLYLSRQMPGFWVDREKGDASTWDWDLDLQQVDMLREAKKRGANLFELFSNSPMWWMCHTGCPAGSLSGIKDNLKEVHHQDFAHYLVSIVIHAKLHWDIEFKYIAPFNEPSSIWWKMSNNQEGCHFGPTSQSRVLNELRKMIDGKRTTETRSKQVLCNLELAASDENQYDQAIDTWESLDDGARDMVSKINVHGYQERHGERHTLHQRASTSGKKLWNSEYGDADATGLSLAINLNLDFHHLHPTAWIYWQALDSGAWGLVRANPNDTWAGHPNAKLFVLAHYSRHIRPGMRILHVKAKGDTQNSVAAYSDDEKKLVLVTLNPWPVVHRVKYDLSRFQLSQECAAVGAAEVKCWSTDIDAACATCGKASRNPAAYIRRATDPLGPDLRFDHWFDSKTIKTFEIQGLEPRH